MPANIVSTVIQHHQLPLPLPIKVPPVAGASIPILHLGVVTNKLCPSGSIQGSLAWDLLLQPRNRWCSASHNTELDRSRILMMQTKITTPHKTQRKKRLFKDATHFFKRIFHLPKWMSVIGTNWRVLLVQGGPLPLIN